MVDYTIQNEVAVISLNHTELSTNVINEVTMKALAEKIQLAIADATVKGLIITSEKQDFLAGADLNMILALDSANQIVEMTNQLHTLFRTLETCGKPVVAAINGTALGGGFELCLACHHRIVLNDSQIQIGLPEVMLGLLPGGGGTQRLPRLIGIQAALQLMLEGKKVRPQEALSMGLVHQLAENKDELMKKAMEFIQQNKKASQPWDNKGFRIPGGDVMSKDGAMIFTAASAMIRKKTYGNYPAAGAILSCVYEGLQLPIEKALQVEARYFAKCVLTKESRAMIRTLFFSMNDANKGGARPKDFPKTKLNKVGILGAGMMGAGIAYVSANAGLDVVLKDISVEAAEKGKNYTRDILQKKVSKGYMSEVEMSTILNKIQTTADPNALKGCDLVVEAVFEDRNLKAKVTQESEAVLEADAVFASNTSTLPISGLAEASKNAANFIGLHFFSPVDKMPLVEIIMGKETSPYALAKSIDFLKKIKKTPIVVNDGRGFYTSRVFATYVKEGISLLEEGVAPALIENAGKMAGMPVAPLALADEVSIELLYHIFVQTEKDLGITLDEAAGRVGKLFVEKLGRLGKKNKKGFYEYPEGGKKYLWPGLTEHFTVIPDKIPLEDIKNRLLVVQSIEAAKCLQENIVTRPEDADLGSILGWGFAPYSGGALSFVDFLGIDAFVQIAQDLEKKYGKRFEVPAILLEMQKNGTKFYA